MGSPNNDAHPALTSAGALHEILESLTTGNGPITSAWSRVLAAKLDTVEFSQRHSQVVCLWNDTTNEIKALYSERTRERLLTYSIGWWKAIIAPTVSWDGNISPSQLIDRAALDLLGTAAELIAAQLHGTALADVTPTLTELRAQCAEWIDVLETTNEIADATLRRTLQQQVNHLIWLLDNANLFGLASIVKSGDQLSGALVRLATSPANQIKDSEDFWGRVKKLAATLAIISGLISNSNTIIEAAKHSVPAIESAIQRVTDPGEVIPPVGETELS